MSKHISRGATIKASQKTAHDKVFWGKNGMVAPSKKC